MNNAMELALGVLKRYEVRDDIQHEPGIIDAIAALKSSLAFQPTLKEALVTMPLKQQGEPVAWLDFEAEFHFTKPEGKECKPLYTSTPTIPAGMVPVSIALLKRIESALGSFCSDEGWGQDDMDVMDSVSAILAAPEYIAASCSPTSSPEVNEV